MILMEWICQVSYHTNVAVASCIAATHDMRLKYIATKNYVYLYIFHVANSY